MAEEKQFRLEIISPDRIFYEGPADMLEIRTTEGEIGILRDHIPLTAMLVPCIVNIKNNGEVKHAAIHDGFIEILKDKVVVLSESCESNLNMARAELALRKSLIRLELAGQSKS